MLRHTAAREKPTAIRTTSKHAWRQLPFHSKSYLYLFRKSGTKFPADWKNIIFFYQGENLKFVGTKKNLPVWSLWGMNLKLDLAAARAFHPVIWHLKRKKNFFPFFFYFPRVSPPTFKSGHTHTSSSTSYSTWYKKKCSLLRRIKPPSTENSFRFSRLIFLLDNTILLPFHYFLRYSLSWERKGNLQSASY